MNGESTRSAPGRGLGRQFHRLWAASAVSNLSDGVALVAAPLLAATLTHDPARVAGLTFVQLLPWLTVPLLSGALVDRLDRRRAMAAVALWRALLIGVLGAALLRESMSLALLYTVVFLLSAGETLFDTAAATLVPALVPSEGLPRANARLAGTAIVMNNFLGRPLGGLLFGVALALPFLAGAGGLAASALLMLSLRGSFRPTRGAGMPRRGMLPEIAEGVRWLWEQRLLRTLAVLLALLNLALVAHVSVMVLFARERLSLGAVGYGLLAATHAVGAVAGSAIAGQVIDRLGESRVLRLALLIEVAIPLVIVVASDPVVTGVALAIFGAHAMVWGSLIASLRQELTPDPLRGRVEGATRMLESGSAAPGALLGGWLAVHFGLGAPFWLNVAVALLIVPFAWPAFSPAAVAEAHALPRADATALSAHPG